MSRHNPNVCTWNPGGKGHVFPRVEKEIVLHRENQILGVEELMYIVYLIMILNVQQVLLKAILGAIIVAHGPVEMSFGCFCCNQNRGIFIFSITILGKNVPSP